jgi:glycosyltransferase involved in cell wall biosynthesis
MRPRVGLLHYTCPPVIGGVETVLYEQATRLSGLGYPLTILAGRGGPLPSPTNVQLVIIPDLDSKREQSSDTLTLERLKPHLSSLDVLIVHNALTLHFNLSLTAALWTAAGEGSPRIISWCHDLSWANPLYLPLLQPHPPWSLLKQYNPKIRTVCVSEQRRQQWLQLSGAPPETALVIPNGIDAAGVLRLTPATRDLHERLGLDRVDALLLAPVRITKRKNLEWAIEAAAAVRASGRRVRLLITGPPGPHNPRALDYVDELRELRRRLGLDDEVTFLFEETGRGASGDYPIDAQTLYDLYMLSDVVTLPSSGEGFGLPLAEAALYRVPVVCTDLPAFREIASEGVRYVPVEAGSKAFSAAVLAALDDQGNTLRRRVLREYSWDRIIRERLEPLLNEAP